MYGTLLLFAICLKWFSRVRSGNQAIDQTGVGELEVMTEDFFGVLAHVNGCQLSVDKKRQDTRRLSFGHTAFRSGGDLGVAEGLVIPPLKCLLPTFGDTDFTPFGCMLVDSEHGRACDEVDRVLV